LDPVVAWSPPGPVPTLKNGILVPAVGPVGGVEAGRGSGAEPACDGERPPRTPPNPNAGERCPLIARPRRVISGGVGLRRGWAAAPSEAAGRRDGAVRRTSRGRARGRAGEEPAWAAAVGGGVGGGRSAGGRPGRGG